MSPSCQACRKRKRKCDFKTPCSNCDRTGIECLPSVTDKRSHKHSNTYIRHLETRVAVLEKLLSNQEEDTNGNNEGTAENEIKKTKDLSNEIITDSNKEGTSFSVYGASSVLIPESINSSFTDQPSSPLDFETFHNPWILTCVSNFFLWQYPDMCIFIHRESFLTDFFKGKDDLKVSLPYCSEELIYAICSLSADMGYDNYDEQTDNTSLRMTGAQFYDEAKSIIFRKLTDMGPDINIPTIQALLCLSFYNLSRGENSSAWLLSGIAFRISHSMGFELDPTNWKLKDDKHIYTEYDKRVKSRIYWGCYVADSFICLIQGRNPILQLSKASLPDSDDLPYLKGIENFLYKDPLNQTFGKGINISLDLKWEVELYKIVNVRKSKMFALGIDKLERINELMKLNIDLQDWKQDKLPIKYRWSKLDLRRNGHNTRFMNFRFQYYLVILCLNRPFITSEHYREDASIKLWVESSLELCLESINDIQVILRRFIEVEQIHESHTILLMVYVTISSIMILSSLDANDHEISISQLKFFIAFLQTLSKRWVIADKYYQIIGRYSNQSSSKAEKELRISNNQSTTQGSEDCQMSKHISSTQNDLNMLDDLDELNENSDYNDFLSSIFEDLSKDPLFQVNDLSTSVFQIND